MWNPIIRTTTNPVTAWGLPQEFLFARNGFLNMFWYNSFKRVSTKFDRMVCEHPLRRALGICMFLWLSGFIDRICSVAGAFVCTQIPLFMHQYHQQLIGRLAELSKFVQQMREAAELSGKTLDQYVAKFLHSTDADFAKQGEIIQRLIDRWKDLQHSSFLLSEATPLSRPWQFIAHLDTEIAQTTLTTFEFGIPLTIEGFLYALAGMGLGYLLFSSLRAIFTLCRKGFRGCSRSSAG